MASYATIRPEQILLAHRRLQDLPEKEERKTRQEAAQLLENDFRKAMKKGYTPEEIRDLLKAENIIIPAYLIRRYFRDDGRESSPKTSPSRQAKPDAIAPKTDIVEPQSFIVPDTPDEEL